MSGLARSTATLACLVLGLGVALAFVLVELREARDELQWNVASELLN